MGAQSEAIAATQPFPASQIYDRRQQRLSNTRHSIPHALRPGDDQEARAVQQRQQPAGSQREALQSRADSTDWQTMGGGCSDMV